MNNDKKILLIYLPCKDSKEATAISEICLSKKVVACANIFPINSMYHWEGKITNDNEVVLILKTFKRLINPIETIIKKNHSYNISAIIQIQAKVNKSYHNWMKSVIISK
jgi:periplasmic divalent cation tolerance protein